MDSGLLAANGAPEPAPDKFVTLATLNFVAGLATQRSPFTGFATNRADRTFYKGRPDALCLPSSNVEISNKLTLQRRPGVIPYGVSNIPSPIAFYDWELATTADINLVVDTATSGGDNVALANGAVFRYSPTASGIYVNKAALSQQTNFFDVVNTLYMGDGVDLLKVVGPNLLTQSNTFGTGAGTNFSIQSPWTEANVFALTGGQADPLGTLTATQLVWGTTGSTAFIDQLVGGGDAVTGPVVPNYTPIANNTFTFSIWLKETGGAETVTIEINDQSGTIASHACVLTAAWQKFQVTGTMLNTSTAIHVRITNPTTTNTMVIYGAQLEVGGPATTTQITTTKPQGVYLWGITAPTTAPTFTTANQVGSTGLPWQPSTNYTLGQTVVDSNGFLQKVTAAGLSGNTQPIWNTQPLGVTTDGIQNAVIQNNSGFANATTLALPFTSNVTAGSTLFAFIFGDVPATGVTLAVSDSASNSWASVASVNAGNQHAYVYRVASAAAGATTVTSLFSSPAATGVWMCIAEVSGLGVLDVSNTNSARDTSSTAFDTGLVTTTNATDFLITFASFSNNTGNSSEIGTAPTGFAAIASQTGLQSRSSGHYLNLGVFIEFLANTTVINPSWTIASPKVSNALTGITVAYKTTTGTLQWTNQGTTGAGLTTILGYQWYYAYMNSYSGHVSNVSPASVSTGVITGQVASVTGATRTMANSGTYSTDPQSDLIVVFRNTDGGAFFYQDAVFGNGSAAQAALLAAGYPGLSTAVTYGGGNFVFKDTTPDSALNTAIFAPIALLNTPPPAGLKDMDYFAGRMWGSVGNILYYSTGPDNAALLNVGQNGVAAESWIPDNFVPFNAPITRIVATGGGLVVGTTQDIWLVTGTSILNGGFNAQKILIGHGIRSYNGVTYDGSNIFVVTSDRQCLNLNPNSGSTQPGFAIGDLLESTVDPTTVYLARHVGGSTDDAMFLATPTGWYRLNPNQQTASLGGETTPLWSPFADFSVTLGGIAAIASIETSPGVSQLLVGQTTVGPVLVRSLSTFTDNGTQYTWNASIGSFMLATAGKTCEVSAIVTDMTAASATQCAVGVLFDEISNGGVAYTNLPSMIPDPPGNPASTTVLSNRFYTSRVPADIVPVVKHMCVQLSGATAATKDEILGMSIIGALAPEQV